MKFNRKPLFADFRAFLKRAGKSLTQLRTDGLSSLLDQFEATPIWSDSRFIAYALATICVETDWTFEPIEEYSSGKQYENRKTLGNTQDGDGPRFKGRGLVQITGRKNYRLFSDLLNVDLVSKPKLALSPTIAFEIMTRGMFEGRFTGKKFSTFINDSGCDYKNARRIINGLDRAAEIAGYAQQIQAILDSAAAPAESPSNILDTQPADPVSPVQIPPSAPPPTILERVQDAVNDYIQPVDKVTDIGNKVAQRGDALKALKSTVFHSIGQPVWALFAWLIGMPWYVYAIVAVLVAIAVYQYIHRQNSLGKIRESK